jgi:hypothetical protein
MKLMVFWFDRLFLVHVTFYLIVHFICIMYYVLESINFYNTMQLFGSGNGSSLSNTRAVILHIEWAPLNGTERN